MRLGSVARSPRVSSTSPLWNPRVERGIWIAIFTRLTNTSRPQRPSSCCISTRNASWSRIRLRLSTMFDCRERIVKDCISVASSVGFWIHHSFLLLFLCISVEREYVMVIGLSKRIPQTVGIFLFIFIGILLRVSAKITPRCYVHRTVTSSNHIYVPGIFWDLVEGRNDYPMLNWTKVGAQGICATNYF